MNTEAHITSTNELNEAALQEVSAGIIPLAIGVIAGIAAVGGYLCKDVENDRHGRGGRAM